MKKEKKEMKIKDDEGYCGCGSSYGCCD